MEAPSARHDPAFRTQDAVYRRYWSRAYAGLPIAIVNRGRTRGDDLAELKMEGDVGATLTAAVTAIA